MPPPSAPAPSTLYLLSQNNQPSGPSWCFSSFSDVKSFRSETLLLPQLYNLGVVFFFAPAGSFQVKTGWKTRTANL